MVVAITHPDATEQDRARALKTLERVVYICASEATLDMERIDIALNRSPEDWDEVDERLMAPTANDGSTRH
jgi:hypothetical protein